MKIDASKIDSLEISDDLKADLKELFGSISAKETEISGMKAKLPTDSQKVVESVDYDKFVAAQAELARLKTELESKVNQAPAGEGDNILAAFSSFF